MAALGCVVNYLFRFAWIPLKLGQKLWKKYVQCKLTQTVTFYMSRSFHELEEFKSKEAAARMQVQLRVATHASSSPGT